MSGRRSSGRGWEIRLGPLQVVVWLGLALGAIYGSYFIGFFSGKYVGFEDARSASGGEVSKLALNEEIPERSPKGWDNVYGKLGGAAVVGQDGKAATDKKVAESKAAEQRTVKAVQETQQGDALSTRENSPNVVVKKDLLSDTDSIFTSDIGGGAALIDESPPKQISGRGGQVRVLGREVESLDGAAKTTTGGADQAKSEDSVVEASPSTARKVKASEREVAAPVPQRKPVAEPKGKETGKEKVSVVRRLPRGYFAQVAAPKTRAEAEDLARKIRRSGFPVVIEDNSTGRSPFYRVMVGPEDNKVQADRMLGQLKREKYLTGKAFVREVK